MNEGERMAYLAKRLPVMQRLQMVLDGKCSDNVCPIRLSYLNGWTCESCVILFEGVADLKKLHRRRGFYRSLREFMNPCPCILLGAEAIVHLDNMVDFLERWDGLKTVLKAVLTKAAKEYEEL